MRKTDSPTYVALTTSHGTICSLSNVLWSHSSNGARCITLEIGFQKLETGQRLAPEGSFAQHNALDDATYPVRASEPFVFFLGTMPFEPFLATLPGLVYISLLGIVGRRSV